MSRLNARSNLFPNAWATLSPYVSKQFLKTTPMPVAAAELFAWHSRPGAFERLAPPWETLRIFERSGTMRDGDRLIFGVKKGPLWLKWEALHRGYHEPTATDPVGRFVDDQIRGPFAAWSHLHRCEPLPDGSVHNNAGQPGHNISQLVDQVTYRLPGGPLGSLFGSGIASAVLDQMFTFRHARTALDLQRHDAARQSLTSQGSGESLRIAMTGSSGAIGRELVHFLTTGGHRVDRLVRRKADAARNEIFWQPGAGARGGQIDDASLEGADAIIHLAGEGVASGRWTEAKKIAIRDSRIEGTRLIARTAAALAHRPKVLLVASGVHYYGDRGESELTEDASLGSGFLAEVSRDWEAAVLPAVEAGIRVVVLRIGLVLSPKGGLLATLVPLAKLGLLPVLGNGKQWWSWIGQDDLFGLMLHCLTHPNISGPVNAVAPRPVRMRDFAGSLAGLLERPLSMRIPTVILRSAFGEMAEIATTSTRAVPDALRRTGFTFAHPDLDTALAWEVLGRPADAGK